MHIMHGMHSRPTAASPRKAASNSARISLL
jgi:hypothetical protein